MGLWDVFDYVVRKSVSKVKESREVIVQAITHPATKQALNLFAPGGALAAYKIVESVLMGNNQNQNQNDIDEQKKYEHVIQQMKILKAENERMQKELKLITNNSSSSSSSSSTVLSEQKPEEVLTESMTKGHKTNKEDLLDNHPVVVVPSIRRSKL